MTKADERYAELARKHLEELEGLAAEAAELATAAAKVGDVRVAAMLTRERRELVLAVDEARRRVAHHEL